MADYRRILKKRIETNGNWSTHPWGEITMQIHHIISKKGYALSNLKKRLKKELNNANYDIDVPENLVAIPSEYRGACHLEVQLHKGNHPKVNGESYHQIVAGLIDGAFDELTNKDLCNSPKKVQRIMNAISEEILERINSFQLPLTNDGIHKSFKKGEKSGCRNLAIGSGKKLFMNKQDQFEKDGVRSINETCCITNNRTKYRKEDEKIKVLDLISKQRRQAHYETKTPHTLKVGN